MKKCTKCGALQSDDKRHCIDCGSLLGKSLSASEEKVEKSAIGSKVDAMADAAEDFYVPRRDKIMAVLCFIGIIAAILLIILCHREISEINSAIPDGDIVVITGGSVTVVSPDGEESHSYTVGKMEALEKSVVYAIASVACFISAFPMLVFPKITWFFATLRYRLFFSTEPSPSDFALIFFKVITYLMFVAGIISLFYGYLLFL